MRITLPAGKDKQAIDEALAYVNSLFDGNVQYKDISSAHIRRDGRLAFRVTLRVKDSHGKGARYGFSMRPNGKRRATVAACWHVFGYFIDALPEGTEIVTGGQKTHPGNLWRDWNAGSLYRPVKMSQLCNCHDH